MFSRYVQKIFLVSFLLVSFFWYSKTFWQNIDCLQLDQNKDIQTNFKESYTGHIECGYYDNYNFKLTPLDDYNVTERFNITWTDRFMLLDNSTDKSWIYKWLDPKKQYMVDLTNYFDKDWNLKDFEVKIIDENGNQVVKVLASNSQTLPIFNFSKLVILFLDNVKIDDLNILYSTKTKWDLGKITISWINAKDWYDSKGTCNGKDCTRKYFYQWVLGTPKNWKVDKVLLNIYFDFWNDWIPDTSDLVWSTSYTLPTPLDVTEAHLQFDETYKSIDLGNISNLWFTNSFKYYRIKFYSDIIDWTFILKGIQEKTLLPQDVASTLWISKLPQSCIDLGESGVQTNWFYTIYPKLTWKIWIKTDDKGIRLWEDWTYAKDCSGYKYPTDWIHIYSGSIGSGWYWVETNKPVKLITKRSYNWNNDVFTVNLKDVSKLQFKMKVNWFRDWRNNVLGWDPSSNNDLFLFVLKHKYYNKYWFEINNHEYYYNQIFEKGKTYNISIVFDWSNKKTLFYVDNKLIKKINEVPNKNDNKLYVGNENGSSYSNITISDFYVYDTSTNTGPTKVYCDMVTNGGGRTLAAKIANNSDKWYYDSSYWTTNNTLNEDTISDINADEDYKSGVFNNSTINNIRVCMGDPSNCVETWNIFNNTFKDIFNSSENSITTNIWKKQMLKLGSVPKDFFANQNWTYKEWINLAYKRFKVRFGILFNNENDTNSMDSYIGIGISPHWQNWGDVRSANSAGWKVRTPGIKKTKQAWIWVKRKPDPNIYTGIQVYCDFTTPWGPYWFKWIKDWIKVNKWTNTTSCEEFWLKPIAPTNYDMLRAAQNFAKNIVGWDYYNGSIVFPLFIYNTIHNSSSCSSWDRYKEMVSWNPDLTDWWTSSLWSTIQWYMDMDNTKIREPNGDYYKNALLGYRYGEYWFIRHFNDAKDSYSYDDYICVDSKIADLYNYNSEEAKNTSYSSCKDIKNNKPEAKDWYYWIKPSGVNVPVKVYCDMTTNWGGWTRIKIINRNFGDNFVEKLRDMWLTYSEVLIKDIEWHSFFDQNNRNSSWDLHNIPYYNLLFVDSDWKTWMVWHRNWNSNWNSDPWRWCNNNNTPNNFIPFSNITVVNEGNWICLYGSSNFPELCARGVIFNFGKNIRLTKITDMESYYNGCTSDNTLKAYMDIYVR